MDGKYVLRGKAKSLREFGNKEIGAAKSWVRISWQFSGAQVQDGSFRCHLNTLWEHGDSRPGASLPSRELDSQRRLGNTEPDLPESRPGGHGRRNSQAPHFSPERGRCLTRAGGQARGPGRLAGATAPGAAAGTAGPRPDRQHLEKNKSCLTLSSSLPDDRGRFPPTRRVPKRRTGREGLAPARDGGGDALMGKQCRVYTTAGEQTASGELPPYAGALPTAGRGKGWRRGSRDRGCMADSRCSTAETNTRPEAVILQLKQTSKE